MEDTPSRTAHPRKPWAAGLLTLWMPGLGQLYSGHWKRALVLWLGGPLLLWVLAFAGLPKSFAGLLVWCGAGLLYLAWVLWDAVRLAREAGRATIASGDSIAGTSTCSLGLSPGPQCELR